MSQPHIGIQCPHCLERIFSLYTHDFKYCWCKYCFVDGGHEYLRYGWGDSPPESVQRDPEAWKRWAEDNPQIKPTEVVAYDYEVDK